MTDIRYLEKFRLVMHFRMSIQVSILSVIYNLRFYEKISQDKLKYLEIKVGDFIDSIKI